MNSEDEKVHVQIIAGNWNKVPGAFVPATDISVFMIDLKKRRRNGSPHSSVTSNIFYFVQGEVQVDGKSVKAMNLVQFGADGDQLRISSSSDGQRCYVTHSLIMNPWPLGDHLL